MSPNLIQYGIVVNVDPEFGRPRDVDAMRLDPRFAELRQHIWHQLHTARPRRAAREVA